MNILEKIIAETELTEYSPEMVLASIRQLCEESEPVFTRQQLSSFGNYLLSEERKSLYTGELVAERLSVVNHADVENWLIKDQNVQVSDTRDDQSESPQPVTKKPWEKPDITFTTNPSTNNI